MTAQAPFALRDLLDHDVDVGPRRLESRVAKCIGEFLNQRGLLLLREEILNHLNADQWHCSSPVSGATLPVLSSRLEPISKLVEEDNKAGKLDKAKEIVGVVLPANEDPALPLNPDEEALDEPA
jgi:hypothetical protein